jgi:hypothetical protein
MYTRPHAHTHLSARVHTWMVPVASKLEIRGTVSVESANTYQKANGV